MKNLFFSPLKRSAIVLAAALGFAGSASATLIDRGGGLIYDNVLNITWLQDANYAKTSGFDASGLMTWASASAWAANLSYFDSERNVTYSDWRLPWASVGAMGGPTTSVVNCTTASETACRANELGHMLFYDLNGASNGFVPDINSHHGSFNGPVLNNIQRFYWSGTASDSALAWGYRFNSELPWDFLFPAGNQSDFDKSIVGGLGAWAVRDGDVVAAIPEPEPYVMLLAGLAVLGFAARRRRLNDEAAA